ncbi:MAG: DUF2345 domain-containing protein, partial [Iodobacter sp.]
PLLEGTEVAIAFTGGHPDRPYIAHAMHDSGHPDHVSQSNHTRNIIRTQSNNKLRMEDKSKQEHIKLSTEFGGKSQLNLGHLVDGQRAQRGAGFELRSDSHGAIRAGKGLFVSADAQNIAGGQQLDMQAAISQLEQALNIAKSLNEVAGIAQADPADTDAQAASKQALESLKEAGLILSAPAGIALTSPEQIQLATGASLSINAGQDASLSLMKRLTVAAGEAISLFAQKSGIKLFAAQGKVDIQAQNSALNLAAQQDVSVSSSQGKVLVNAKEEILLTSGGGYIRLKDGNIELGVPADVLIKSVALVKRGPASEEQHLPIMPNSIQEQGPYSAKYQLFKRDNRPFEGYAYEIRGAGGEILDSGLSDAAGSTQFINTDEMVNIKAFKSKMRPDEKITEDWKRKLLIATDKAKGRK